MSTPGCDALGGDRVGARAVPEPPGRLLVALDASEYADRALEEAVRIARAAGGSVTGLHAYAARLHDRRFRQMEGGLPERYRGDAALEHQREVHDELIGRGLGIISDSYHDAAEALCSAAGVRYRRLSPEGKNYRRVLEAAGSGRFDLLVLGAQGLGAVPGALLGTVCRRAARRCPIDLLVVRRPDRALGDGPLVVTLDGSARAFGALRTALALASALDLSLHAVAAFDPDFHYAAFRRIAGVLSEEGARVFRFREQERLHEELIDAGLARIYHSHLDVARKVAREAGVDLECRLLSGKPYQVIVRDLEEVGAGCVLAGRTGIHADAGLDIGGNAEALLHLAPCHVWLGQADFTPPLEMTAEETIGWTAEAEARMARIPERARSLVRMLILRVAEERGHTVVTAALIDEATERLCPMRHRRAAEPGPAWR